MKKYRKKPVVVEAMLFTGSELSGNEIIAWADSVVGKITYIWEELRISTLEGEMAASAGDYIIRGVEDEFYPCKPDIFAKTYEEVKE